MTAKKALGVLVSGRGSNLQAILDAIHAGRLPLAKVGVVISDNPEAKALLRVRGMGIPTVVLERKAFADRAAYETALADELERIVTLHGAETIAAVIVEPMAGSTAVNAARQSTAARIFSGAGVARSTPVSQSSAFSSSRALSPRHRSSGRSQRAPFMTTTRPLPWAPAIRTGRPAWSCPPALARAS